MLNSTIERLTMDWREALATLDGVARRGTSLGNGERHMLKRAGADCAALVAALAGLGADREMARVAGGLAEVVQPIYSRAALAENLLRARADLGRLATCEAGLERLALEAPQLAWLQAFLSACSRDLGGDPVESRSRPLAVGS